MAKLNLKILLAATGVVTLAACSGGTDSSQTLSSDAEVATTLQDTTGDAQSATGEVVDLTAASLAEVPSDGGWTDLQNNWQDSIGSIKDQWADLTEEELLAVDGDREQLVSLVQEKYGLDRQSAEMEVNVWASNL